MMKSSLVRLAARLRPSRSRTATVTSARCAPARKIGGGTAAGSWAVEVPISAARSAPEAAVASRRMVQLLWRIDRCVLAASHRQIADLLDPLRRIGCCGPNEQEFFDGCTDLEILGDDQESGLDRSPMT